MSLLQESFEKFIIMDKKTVPDGEGGVITEWKDGAEIMAGFSKDDSMQARIAESQGVKSLYTIITEKSVLLRFADVVKRVRDGKTFRITSDGDDKRTPASAYLNMRAVSAEEWKIP